jgi:hypothetical protein
MEPVTGLVRTAAGKVIGEAKKESDGFLKAALAEPGKALSSLLALPINKRLFRNLVKATAEANRVLKEAGLSPGQVPLSIIHPALQAAALEEDPNLQSAWANLLANAADPRHKDKVLPAFVAILREITPTDALFLSALYQDVMALVSKERRPFVEIQFDIFGLKQIYDAALFGHVPKPPGTVVGIAVDNRFLTLVEIMVRHGILTERTPLLPMQTKVPMTQSVTKTKWSLSNLGWSFMAACQTPTVTPSSAPQK